MGPDTAIAGHRVKVILLPSTPCSADAHPLLLALLLLMPCHSLGDLGQVFASLSYCFLVGKMKRERERSPV